MPARNFSRSGSGRLAILASALLLFGCGEPSEKGATETALSGRFAARFEAAKAIVNVTTRDEALAGLALEAAKAGDGPTVKACIQEIKITPNRDEAAYNGAMQLAKAGHPDAATAVAKLILVVPRRDEALSKLAKGDLGK
jgi:hypothetical protein